MYYLRPFSNKLNYITRRRFSRGWLKHVRWQMKAKSIAIIWYHADLTICRFRWCCNTSNCQVLRFLYTPRDKKNIPYRGVQKNIPCWAQHLRRIRGCDTHPTWIWCICHAKVTCKFRVRCASCMSCSPRNHATRDVTFGSLAPLFLNAI
jgi:hypothetical protein